MTASCQPRPTSVAQRSKTPTANVPRVRRGSTVSSSELKQSRRDPRSVIVQRYVNDAIAANAETEPSHGRVRPDTVACTGNRARPECIAAEDQMTIDPHSQSLNTAFNRARRAERDLSEMLGLAKGMLADGIVNEFE